MKPMQTQDQSSLLSGLRAWLRSASARRGAALALVATLVCTLTGPFNTFGAGSIGERFCYWSVVILISWGCAEFAMRLGRRSGVRNLILREVLTIAAFMTVFLPLLLFWTRHWFPQQVSEAQSLTPYVLGVLAVCLAMSVLRRFVGNMPQGDLPGENGVTPRLLRRLPDYDTGQILRLVGDGHHVHVVTDRSSFDLRMRFSDAVQEMEGVPGFRAHRSHWVAERAIRSADLRKGRPVLILSNRDEVPVSASYQADLEAAGILVPAARGIGTASA